MAQLSESYKKTGDRLSYEEQVEKARSVYDDCIDNCRDRYPVK
jgi:hypothetical protein